MPLIPYESPFLERNEIRKSLDFENDETVMIYVGSIKQIKGSDFLVNSFIKLGKEFFKKNKLRMVFIGDGELRNELEEVVNNNNMNNEIIFLGLKKKEEIPNYLNASDIFIFASILKGLHYRC